jgi:heat shock protein HspQ
VFYHVLVDARDWPPEGDAPPVAYVAEELLASCSSADFSSDQPLVDASFEHPYRCVCVCVCVGGG